MKNKIATLLLHTVLPIIFWIGVWEVAAIIVDRSYFLPHTYETAEALSKIVFSADFFKTTAFTLLRVTSGILLGTLLGAFLAIISHRIKFVYSLISPLNSVIKATPVASIIVLLWISMNGNYLAVFVALLMVFPIIFRNIYDAFESIDKELIEVARIFEFSYKKKMKILVLPALKKYFLPALVTAIGLAFKAEIAAEIIAGVRHSIGQMIYDAKDALITSEVFAWTIVGVVLSILVEKLAKVLLLPKSDTKKEAEI